MYVAKNSTPLFFYTAKTRLLLPHLSLITFVIVIITTTIFISSTGCKEERRATDWCITAAQMERGGKKEEKTGRTAAVVSCWSSILLLLRPRRPHLSLIRITIYHQKNLSSGIFRPSPQQKKLLGDPFLTQFLIRRPPPVDPFLVFPTWRHCGPSSPPGSHRAV